MDLSVGEIILYGLLIVGIFAFLIMVVAKVSHGGTSYPPEFTEPPPMHTWTYTRGAPQCSHVAVGGKDYVRLCTLQAGHNEDHSYKRVYIEDL